MCPRFNENGHARGNEDRVRPVDLTLDMPKCTAPVKGHHSAAARAACPACGPHIRASRTQAPSYGLTPATPGIPEALVSASGARTAAARSARLTGSAAGGDLIFWLLLATFVHDIFWLMFFGVLAIVFPVALASQWTYQCSAWINSGTSRCRRPRAGFLQRCHHHTRDDDPLRRCCRRSDSHSRRHCARSLGRLTPLTELSRLSDELSCGPQRGRSEPRNPVRPYA
ncbi:Uncharacterised protein [Mycobacteroides abscessus subsp. abscessus]|nr:Uncharacterised protein [Mycobacteroides abscessus subsp. abscessus]